MARTAGYQEAGRLAEEAMSCWRGSIAASNALCKDKPPTRFVTGSRDAGGIAAPLFGNQPQNLPSGI
jgi:hypothetical protein